MEDRNHASHGEALGKCCVKLVGSDDKPEETDWLKLAAIDGATGLGAETVADERQ